MKRESNTELETTSTGAICKIKCDGSKEQLKPNEKNGTRLGRAHNINGADIFAATSTWVDDSENTNASDCAGINYDDDDDCREDMRMVNFMMIKMMKTVILMMRMMMLNYANYDGDNDDDDHGYNSDDGTDRICMY
ncbi:hypothetical protein DPMN_118258 [Dreissena polymorpha]|uniref:Uncharacterized protein n=1 Tax=Dreissena polymorpha TaxID=45954 RepID=A0A9D4GMS7_DREPO|nr:hypothetical protein DPMN_118258 [Dreissena polymorpha]